LNFPWFISVAGGSIHVMWMTEETMMLSESHFALADGYFFLSFAGWG
jgi:hypothetical protein